MASVRPQTRAGTGPAAEPVDSARSAAATRLRGAPLLAVRGICAALCALSLVLYALNLPLYFRALHHVCGSPLCPSVQLTSVGADIIAHAGLSLSMYAALVFADTLLVTLVYCTVAGVLAWRRSDDWLALLVTFMLVATGTALVFDQLPVPNTAWSFLNNLVGFLAYAPAFFLVFYLFPDGRFRPRWVLWAIVVASLIEAGNNLFPGSALDINHWIPNFENVCFFGILVALAGAQVYRYRRLYSPIQRQQSKWLIFSLTLFAIYGLAVFALGPALLGSLDSNNTVLVVLGPLAFVNVFAVLFPISIAVAMLRYRLWDVDLLINRTLVYGSLTTALAAVYFVLVYALQALVQVGTGQHGQQPAAVVLSTLVVAALFAPVRRRLQRTIDRRFYRRRYDAARTLATFGATLRSEVDPALLTHQLLAVVEETMQPAHLSLWLATPANTSTEHQPGGA